MPSSAGGGVDLPDRAFERNGRWGNRPGAIVEIRMRHAAHVPQLQKDPALGIVHGAGDLSPSGDLFRAVNTGVKE